MNESRSKVFRILKPPCIEVSQVALRYKNRKATGKGLIKTLERLHEALDSVTQDVNLLDSKLADYAFFPLSHVFREVKDLPVRAVEIALQNLRILIAHGWQRSLSLDLGKQLLILLSFLAGGSATDSKVKDVNEELGTTAFESITSLLKASPPTGGILGRTPLESEDIPLLGHCVTVTLDGITEGPSVEVRLAAIKSLDSVIGAVRDLEALRNVFPGIVSSLTKTLSSKGGPIPPFRFLQSGLNILEMVFCKVLRDKTIFGSPSSGQNITSASAEGSDTARSWAIATADQVKMALANILPLRYHDNAKVRDSVFNLCIAIIHHCRESLSSSVPILAESLIVISSQSSRYEVGIDPILDHVFNRDTSLGEILKNSLHDWIVSFPRIMRSQDESKKQGIIQQITLAFSVLERQHLNLEILHRLMAKNLRASVAAAITPLSHTIAPASESSLEVVQLIKSGETTNESSNFETVIFSSSSRKATTNLFDTFITKPQSQPMSASLRREMSTSLRTTAGDEQLADLWLCLQVLRSTRSENDLMSQYDQLSSDSDIQQSLLDNVYSLSLDVLSKSTFEAEQRWKLQCLALEAVALTAQTQRYDFRPELVNALFPILERLASNNAMLQGHAVTCLNIVAHACEYPNAAALIIDNADYLVNAVALKLNTFDISPQAPQILVMMMRLSGAALIPYLDDLVDSIFSILACYHGYPKLVESLFSVLNVIVDEAAKPSKHAIKAADEISTGPKPYRPTSINDLANFIRSNLKATTMPLLAPSSPPPTAEETINSSDPEDTENPSTPPRPSSPPKTQVTRTEKLVDSIAYLTPAHLTTPSPPLRAGILKLLTSALPVLAVHTDNFLPLVATLWSAITPRLYDAEPYLTMAAANVLATLCALAGDFVSTRVEDEWSRLCNLYERVERDMREEIRVQGEKCRARGMRWKVWDAMVGLMVGVVKYVGVNGEMEDAVFEMLGVWTQIRSDVREVLEELNADAIWLLEENRRMRDGGEPLPKPQGIEGIDFRDVVVG